LLAQHYLVAFYFARVSFCDRIAPVSSRSKKARAEANAYLRFLQLSEAIAGLAALPPLDPLEERILAWIARSAHTGERLCVRDMMDKHELGAPATIHSRLKSMRAKGWIALADTDDGRRKQLEVSERALRHFAQLSKAMVRAARGA
jgi:DNA-binding MarR family transcriptional regulator